MNHKLTFLFNFRCEVSKIPQARFLNSPPVAPDLPVAQTSSKSASGCEGTESDGKTHVRLISPKPPSCPPLRLHPHPSSPLSLPPRPLSRPLLPRAPPPRSSPPCTRDMQVTWMQRCGPLSGGAHARRHARTQLPGPGPPLVRARPLLSFVASCGRTGCAPCPTRPVALVRPVEIWLTSLSPDGHKAAQRRRRAHAVCVVMARREVRDEKI